mmetsp:Transcript_60250/g.152990  ORF Transcript_60250/g.152990 Transcript_60250/m.152990 type:complete len:214 (-) Transcript_60250:222-863(-)
MASRSLREGICARRCRQVCRWTACCRSPRLLRSSSRPVGPDPWVRRSKELLLLFRTKMRRRSGSRDITSSRIQALRSRRAVGLLTRRWSRWRSGWTPRASAASRAALSGPTRKDMATRPWTCRPLPTVGAAPGERRPVATTEAGAAPARASAGCPTRAVATRASPATTTTMRWRSPAVAHAAAAGEARTTPGLCRGWSAKRCRRRGRPSPMHT